MLVDMLRYSAIRNEIEELLSSDLLPITPLKSVINNKVDMLDYESILLEIKKLEKIQPKLTNKIDEVSKLIDKTRE